MTRFIDEAGQEVTEEQLREQYNKLVCDDEFEGTFHQYITECTGKNGTLIKVK